MKSTQVQAAMKTEQIDSLAPARGLANGCLLTLALWLIVAACLAGILIGAGWLK